MSDINHNLLKCFSTSGLMALLSATVDWLRDSYLEGRMTLFFAYFDTGALLTFFIGGAAFLILIRLGFVRFSQWILTMLALWFVFAFVLTAVRFFITEDHPRISALMSWEEVLLNFIVLNVFYLGTALAIGSAAWFILFRVFKTSSKPNS